MATSSYYDPDQGMLHLYKDGYNIVGSGASALNELGMEDTAFDDVKFKILSIQYRIKAFCTNLSIASGADNNVNAFNPEELGSAGNVVFGIKNKDDTTTFNDLGDFVGTSAWPVHMDSWATLIGNPASVSKVWKPRKLALSNEQNAFVTLKNNSAFTAADSVSAETWFSIYIRGIRL